MQIRLKRFDAIVGGKRRVGFFLWIGFGRKRHRERNDKNYEK
jgi:hypothetical protein